MKGLLIKDAPVLIPNKEHKNFTENGVVLQKGNVIKGQPRTVEGLRRGKPFTYKLFFTDNNQIIYLNTIKPMEMTEVTLGADSGQTATKVNLIPAEAYSKIKMQGLIVGGIAGFAWAKWKKHDMKKAAMFIGIGAVAGYVAGMLIDRRNKVIVKPSK